ncbi:MAG: ABC transporter permease [Bdellovibrionales bacterium]|nr:ABC transporter permease [Bdellovibrionales bacterium]
MRRYNLFRYIGLRHLSARPSRAILTTLGVAFGISLYVAISIINHSTKNSMRESIEAVSGKARLSVSAGVAGFPESRLEEIRTTPGVKSAVPLIEARAFFEGATESADGLQIMGVDLLQETSVRTYKATDQKIIEDPLTFLNQPDSIILTEALAKKRGLAIDSKISLSTALGVKTFTVRGLLEPEGAARAYGGSLAIMDIDGARVSFGKENKLDRVDIVPTDNAEVSVLQTRLREKMGPGYWVERPESQNEQMDKLLDSYQIILTFFSSLALLVGLFLVMNSISVSIAERRHEIGTLRALGAPRVSMVTLFVVEVFGIGLIGSALGALLGRFLAVRLSTQVTQSVAAQLQMRIDIAKLEFTSENIIFTLVSGTLSAVIAALIPALKSARIHPLESMRRHSESQSPEEENRSRLMIIAGFLLLVFMTCSMILQWSKLWIGIDIISKGSSVLGAALFGPFLVFLFLKAFRRITRPLPFPILRISQGNLMRSRKRTTANVMALMVGLFLVMLISCVRSSFHDTLTNWLDRIFVADVMVGSNGRFINADVQPIKDSILPELLKIKGIRPIGEGHGAGSRIVPFQFKGAKLAIKALDHYAEFYEYRNFPVVDGDRISTARRLFESTEPSLLATQSFLDRAGKKVGELVDLETPSGAIPFRILGKIVDYASSQGVIYLNRAVYARYWNDHLVTVFVFSLESGARFEDVKASIDRELGRKWNLVTISSREFKDQMQSAIERSFAYTRAIEWIALLVGLLGLLNTLLISVMERTREIGMLRAIGSTRFQISKMIFFEAILQGFFGAVVAILLGSYVGKLFVEYTLSTTLGWEIDYHFPKEAILNTILIGVAVAGVAGFFPARRAAQLQITEALDYE